MGMVDYVGRSRKRIAAGDTPRWVSNSRRARYIQAVVLSAPPWVDRWELYALAAFAKALTVFTGKQYVCDHIVPVNHPRICGLTVPWNIQVVTWHVNAAKGNRWDPDQMELFE